MAIITMNNVSKSFGSTQALNNISLSVDSGEVYGFIGPNGAGKTTTIRVLLGIIKADAGTVVMLDKDAWYDAVAVHQHLAYVPGDVKLWPNLTGGEVIDILGRFTRREPLTMKDYFVERFNLDITKKCRSYSKGNRQKVALVAAFSREADVYIFDEPTSGLDPLMEQVFHEEVLKLKAAKKTVFLSSHILSEVEKLCDRVSIIRAGEIIQTGTLDALRHLTRTQVHVQFDARVSLDHLDYLHDYRDEQGLHTFMIDTKQIGRLFKDFSAYEIVKFDSTKPTLESLFMQHYKAV